MFMKLCVRAFFISLSITALALLVLMGSVTLSDLSNWPIEATWKFDGFVLMTANVSLWGAIIAGLPLFFVIIRDNIWSILPWR